MKGRARVVCKRRFSIVVVVAIQFCQMKGARKRAEFSILDRVAFVGNWEVDDVERRVVALN